MNKSTKTTENPKMQRSCKALGKELTNLAMNIDCMTRAMDDPYMRFIPYENWDKAKAVHEFIRWMLRTYTKYMHSNIEVYKFSGYISKKQKELEAEILRKQHQISLFPEEEVRKEIDELLKQQKCLQLVQDICHKGAGRFEYIFHV